MGARNREKFYSMLFRKGGLLGAAPHVESEEEKFERLVGNVVARVLAVIGPDIDRQVRNNDVTNAATPNEVAAAPVPRHSSSGGKRHTASDATPHAAAPTARSQLTAQEARERAMAPLVSDAPREPSATELFIQWSGNARPTWSPPRGWSG